MHCLVVLGLNRNRGAFCLFMGQSVRSRRVYCAKAGVEFCPTEDCAHKGHRGTGRRNNSGFAMMVSRRASTSWVAGWTFSVSPRPDRSPSRYPTGPLTLQCVSLALVLVVEETAPHLSRQRPDRFSCTLRWQAAFRTRSARSPIADHRLCCSRSFYQSRAFFRCATSRHILQADSGF